MKSQKPLTESEMRGFLISSKTAEEDSQHWGSARPTASGSFWLWQRKGVTQNAPMISREQVSLMLQWVLPLLPRSIVSLKCNKTKRS